MQFNHFTPSKAFLGILFTLLVLIAWLHGRTTNQVNQFDLPNIITDSISCTTRSTSNQDTFVAFITDKGMAQDLLESLCNNNVINRQFGQVLVQWSHNEQEIIQYVGKGLADLALVKENVMQAFATTSTHGYKVAAHYRDYATYLISLKEKPKIEKQYLWGKRLGLLDYPSSRSGHIVPKRMLIELDMNEDDMVIVYANSHQALRELLSSGKVDLISSFWHEADGSRFSVNYRTPIESNISGSKWYLKMEKENTDLFCDIQGSLSTLAESTDSEYYSRLIVQPTCEVDGEEIVGSGYE